MVHLHHILPHSRLYVFYFLLCSLSVFICLIKVAQGDCIMWPICVHMYYYFISSVESNIWPICVHIYYEGLDGGGLVFTIH